MGKCGSVVDEKDFDDIEQNGDATANGKAPNLDSYKQAATSGAGNAAAGNAANKKSTTDDDGKDLEQLEHVVPNAQIGALLENVPLLGQFWTRAALHRCLFSVTYVLTFVMGNLLGGNRFSQVDASRACDSGRCSDGKDIQGRKDRGRRRCRQRILHHQRGSYGTVSPASRTEQIIWGGIAQHSTATGTAGQDTMGTGKAGSAKIRCAACSSPPLFLVLGSCACHAVCTRNQNTNRTLRTQSMLPVLSLCSLSSSVPLVCGDEPLHVLTFLYRDTKQAGDYFGETALLNNSARGATIAAVRSLSLLK